MRATLICISSLMIVCLIDSALSSITAGHSRGRVLHRRRTDDVIPGATTTTQVPFIDRSPTLIQLKAAEGTSIDTNYILKVIKQQLGDAYELANYTIIHPTYTDFTPENPAKLPITTSNTLLSTNHVGVTIYAQKAVPIEPPVLLPIPTTVYPAITIVQPSITRVDYNISRENSESKAPSTINEVISKPLLESGWKNYISNLRGSPNDAQPSPSSYGTRVVKSSGFGDSNAASVKINQSYDPKSGGYFNNPNQDQLIFGPVSGGYSDDVQGSNTYGPASGGYVDNVQDRKPYGPASAGYGDNVQDRKAYGPVSGGYGNNVQDRKVYDSVSGGYADNVQNDKAYGPASGGYADNVPGRKAYGPVSGAYADDVQDRKAYGPVSGGYTNNVQNQKAYGPVSGGYTNNVQNQKAYGPVSGGYSNNIVNPGSSYGPVSGGYSDSNSNSGTNYGTSSNGLPEITYGGWTPKSTDPDSTGQSYGANSRGFSENITPSYQESPGYRTPETTDGWTDTDDEGWTYDGKSQASTSEVEETPQKIYHYHFHQLNYNRGTDTPSSTGDYGRHQSQRQPPATYGANDDNQGQVQYRTTVNSFNRNDSAGGIPVVSTLQLRTSVSAFNGSKSSASAGGVVPVSSTLRTLLSSTTVKPTISPISTFGPILVNPADSRPTNLTLVNRGQLDQNRTGNLTGLPNNFGPPQSNGGQGLNTNYGGQGSSTNYGGQGSNTNYAGQDSYTNYGGQGWNTNNGDQGWNTNNGGQASNSNYGNQNSNSNFGGQGWQTGNSNDGWTDSDGWSEWQEYTTVKPRKQKSKFVTKFCKLFRLICRIFHKHSDH